MRKLEKRESMNRRIDVVLNKFRSRMNAYPPGMCPLALYRSLLQISINQSCGKCVPCRDGLPEADHLLEKILDGSGTPDTCKELEDLCRMIVKTSDCAVGVVAAGMILESLKEFPDEYKSHIEQKCCVEEVGQTIPCSTLCPAHVNVPGYVALIKEGDYEGAVQKFLAVQELFMTPTAKYADVIFPVVSFAEKEGTFTNTERRVQRVRKAVEPEGDMRPDTEVTIDLMNAMGYPQEHLTPARIMDEIAELTPSYHGISHERLDALPFPGLPCEQDHQPRSRRIRKNPGIQSLRRQRRKASVNRTEKSPGKLKGKSPRQRQ